MTSLSSARTPRITKFFQPETSRAVDDLCKVGRLAEALEIMEERALMSRDNAYCFLQECVKNKDLISGRRLQSLMSKNGLYSVAILGDNLIRLFSSCNCLFEATQVFKKVKEPSAYTWSSIILAHANLGHGEEAFELYRKMQLSDVQSNRSVYLAVLKACAVTSSLDQGKHIHRRILESGIQLDVVIWNALIDMYIKCGSLDESCRLFDEMPIQDVISWNTLIGGYAQHGKGLLSLTCFEKMEVEGIVPNNVTFLNILKACAGVGVTEHGRLIHSQILKQGLESDVVIGSTLVDMYAKCGSLKDSFKRFSNLKNRNVVSWGAMITGYAQHGEGLLALDCFEKMQIEGIKPNKVIFFSVLKACGSVGAIGHGRSIHDQIADAGIQSDVAVCSSLIDMYVKCGCLTEACNVFETMPIRDVVSWAAMVAGYAEHGEGSLALECFENMQEQGITPDKVVFLSVVKACGSIGAIDQGRLIHRRILKHGLESDLDLGSALVDMYAKCGSLKESQQVFDELSSQDLVTWNALLLGYAMHGEGDLALDRFDRMQEEGVRPDDITLLCILVACSRAGLIDKGRWYFEHMEEQYGVKPTKDHNLCMVDLLGRAGCLKEGEDLLQATAQDNVSGWKSLLSASRMHGNMELGRRSFNKILELDPCCDAAYVLMSNLYADACMDKDMGKVEELGKCAGAINNSEMTHSGGHLVLGDKDRLPTDDFDTLLERVSGRAE